MTVIKYVRTCGGSLRTTSLRLTILQESIGKWLKRCTNCPVPTRGDAKVQNVEISNLPFALFSITTSAAFYFNVPRKAAMFLT